MNKFTLERDEIKLGRGKLKDLSTVFGIAKKSLAMLIVGTWTALVTKPADAISEADEDSVLHKMATTKGKDLNNYTQHLVYSALTFDDDISKALEKLKPMDPFAEVAKENTAKKATKKATK